MNEVTNGRLVTFASIEQTLQNPMQKAMAQMLVIVGEFVEDSGYEASPIWTTLDSVMGEWT